MTARQERATLPDGRTLSYVDLGDPDGAVAVVHHGFPGSSLQFRGLQGVAENAGVRLVAPDRPGVGGSDPLPGRGFAAWAPDVEALLDHLEVPQAHLLGVSAGGAFAMAASAGLPSERVGRLALVSSVCPWSALRGTLPAGWFRFFWAVRHVPFLAEMLLGRELRRARRDPTHHLLAASGPEGADAVILESGAGEVLRESFLEACRQGVGGISHEARLLAGPWDVDPADAAPGARVWHGEADRAVPVEAGRFLARTLPGAQGTFLPDEGHVSVFVNHADEILAWLAGT